MIVGFSGHQKIDHPERWGWVRDQFAAILRERATGDTRVMLALAEGGDQAFAEAAMTLGLPVDAVIPCSRYEETFPGDAKAKYRELLAGAATTVTLEFVEPSEEAFLAAGKYVADHCDLLVTLWNGKAAAGKGGTGDVAVYARSMGKPVIHVHPDLLEVTGPG
jgi:hypothetical protein